MDVHKRSGQRSKTYYLLPLLLISDTKERSLLSMWAVIRPSMALSHQLCCPTRNWWDIYWIGDLRWSHTNLAANKMINGERFTTVLHVDNLKLSHKEVEQVRSDMIAMLESIYATVAPLTVHRGKLHHYLGMTMDFRTHREVQITMHDGIKKLINLFVSKDMVGNKHTTSP